MRSMRKSSDGNEGEEDGRDRGKHRRLWHGGCLGKGAGKDMVMRNTAALILYSVVMVRVVRTEGEVKDCGMAKV